MKMKMKKGDTSRLQGTWHITALEVDGQPATASGQIEVKGDRFTGLGMGAVYEGKLLVDATLKPATIDMVFTKGPEKGNTNRGIFEFTGDDRWRLCLQMSGKDRPKKFATSQGGGLALETLERAPRPALHARTKAGKAVAPPPDFPTDAIPELAGEWQMIAMAFNGAPLEETYCKMGKRVAQGNEVTVFMGPQTILKAFYAIDRSQRPHTMDYAVTHGSAKGKKQFGIFEMAGDSFTTSFAAPGKPRPTDFTSNHGDGRTVTTWRRTRE
jgi:uncharacterized protein (TIGR03067 family)